MVDVQVVVVDVCGDDVYDDVVRCFCFVWYLEFWEVQVFQGEFGGVVENDCLVGFWYVFFFVDWFVFVFDVGVVGCILYWYSIFSLVWCFVL